MKRYEFTITLGGYGENADEAWEDAYEGFSQDPGATPDESEYTVEDEEEICDCQREGYFCSGFKGILAHVENGKLITKPDKVERCDICKTFKSDKAALKALRKLLKGA